ncbi:MAG: heme-binding domain-containing protein [Bacteroidetes bacterium]|nr:heme-binding domain-containing protein [Bacteroidota bacterium]
MKKIRNKLLIGLAVLAIVIQFIPGYENKSSQEPHNSISGVYEIPPNVKGILRRSCYDCHSDNTRYPWYMHIQPVRYLLDRHVRHGKEDLNFDEFGTYSERKRRNKLRAIGNSLTEGSMPLSSYLLVHRSARMSRQDTTAVLSWIRKVNTVNKD